MGNTVPGRRNSILSKEGSVSEPSRQNTICDSDPISPGPQPEPLTPEQMELLTRTWKMLEDDIAHVGVITFISLFETHPDVQQGFMSFSGIELEDLKHSKQLRAHALR
ncbi:hypothetical protein GE061_014258 [Apolygus lucorum]|uniref:Globin domain-containing protein n=1 Tax=Apolygus lucorum TaxID=248454 RepID=A0A6A4JVD7_APOLU|nr:hypothetical protein GE061_014258 [Apolygus lucorum]